MKGYYLSYREFLYIWMKIVYPLKENYTEDANFIDTKFTNKCQYPINMEKCTDNNNIHIKTKTNY